jgi:type IV pilus assembly protein PilB
MGVPAFNIASSVNLILAQRLARRLCEHCKQPDDLAREALLKEGFSEADLEGDWKVYKAVGCNKCTQGYKGRVGLFEVMPVTEEIERLIMENANAVQLRNQANREGVEDLRASGLRKVRAGITSLEELNRVTKD